MWAGFGHGMLVKMGWGGTGEPLQEGGIADPVEAVGNGSRHKGLAGEDEALLLATETSFTTEAARGVVKRQRWERLPSQIRQPRPSLSCRRERLPSQMRQPFPPRFVGGPCRQTWNPFRTRRGGALNGSHQLWGLP